MIYEFNYTNHPTDFEESQVSGALEVAHELSPEDQLHTVTHCPCYEQYRNIGCTELNCNVHGQRPLSHLFNSKHNKLSLSHYAPPPPPHEILAPIMVYLSRLRGYSLSDLQAGGGGL